MGRTVISSSIYCSNEGIDQDFLRNKCKFVPGEKFYNSSIMSFKFPHPAERERELQLKRHDAAGAAVVY